MKNHALIPFVCAAGLMLAGGCSSGYGQGSTEERPQAISDSGISSDELRMRLAMRELWADHVWYTREYINSVAGGLPDKGAVADRLLKNQDDIGNAIKPYFGDEAGAELTRLLQEHIMIATQVVGAAKVGDDASYKKANESWAANANAIADFLSVANPDSWPQDGTRAMMKEHLDLTTTEAVTRLKGDWKANIEAFQRAHDQAMHMADMLGDGLVAKFPDKF